MLDFSNFIYEQGLMDLPLVGGTFTWSNNRNSPSWSRIDRLLVSPEWKANFLDLFHIRVHRLCLDHFPFLLDCGGIQGGKRSIKFENVWLKKLE
jgi:hypothetical protein